MSHPQNDIWNENLEELNYFDRLLQESLNISKAKMRRALELRSIANRLIGTYYSLDDYAKLCEKNNLLLF